MRGRGLEPPWVTPLAPKASASASFATRAHFYYFLLTFTPMYSFDKDVIILIIHLCAPSRDRTYDLILKRDLLYQLSYGRKLNIRQ